MVSPPAALAAVDCCLDGGEHAGAPGWVDDERRQQGAVFEGRQAGDEDRLAGATRGPPRECPMTTME